MELHDYHRKVLAVLDSDGGFTTGDIAKQVKPQFGHNAIKSLCAGAFPDRLNDTDHHV